MIQSPLRDRPAGETGGSAQRPARRLAASSLAFDLTVELALLEQEPSWVRGDRNARTLVEEPGLRIILTVLRLGTRIREHRTDGRVCIETTRGHLRVHAAERAVDLPVGHIVVLDRGVPHDIEAVEDDSAFLLTVALGVS